MMRMGHSTSGRNNNGFRPTSFQEDDDVPMSRMANSTSGRDTYRPSRLDQAGVPMQMAVRMAHETTGRDTFAPSAFPSTGAVVHTEAGCDGCGALPLCGVRYKCLFCPNYDLCTPCLEKVENFQPSTGRGGSSKEPIHDPSHRFVRMASAIPVSKLPTYLQNREDMVHRGIACNTCDKREIVGFRYFCPQCGVSLCEACELIGKWDSYYEYQSV